MPKNLWHITLHKTTVISLKYDCYPSLNELKCTFRNSLLGISSFTKTAHDFLKKYSVEPKLVKFKLDSETVKAGFRQLKWYVIVWFQKLWSVWINSKRFSPWWAVGNSFQSYKTHSLYFYKLKSDKKKNSCRGLRAKLNNNKEKCL